MPEPDAYTPLEEAARAALERGRDGRGLGYVGVPAQDVIHLIGKAREAERLRAAAVALSDAFDDYYRDGYYRDFGPKVRALRAALRAALAPREEGA